MENILILDAKNYDDSLPEIKRIPVRAIIFIDVLKILKEKITALVIE